MEFTQVIDEDGDPVCVYCDGHVDLRHYGRAAHHEGAKFVREMVSEKMRASRHGPVTRGTFYEAACDYMAHHLPDGIVVAHFHLRNIRGEDGPADFYLEICPADAAGAFPATGTIFAK
jgi:hypothetical protein